VIGCEKEACANAEDLKKKNNKWIPQENGDWRGCGWGTGIWQLMENQKNANDNRTPNGGEKERFGVLLSENAL